MNESPPAKLEETTTVTGINDKEWFLDELNSLKAEVLEQLNSQVQVVQERNQRLENDLAEARRGVLAQEMSVLNAVAKHNAVLENNLRTGSEEISDFFRELPELEQTKGKLGAYETVLAKLRQVQSMIAIADMELQAQKMQWNRLIERLRLQQ